MKAIIVDDEKKARENLSNMLGDHCPDVSVLEQCNSVESAFEAIQELNPDIVFLDIEMPGGSGFDLLKRFDEIRFEIIFTTAFQDFAIEAIKFSALDYLLKPMDPDELIAAIEKLKKKNVKNDQSGFQALINNLNASNNQQVAIPDIEGMTIVELSKIVRCQADKNYTEVWLEDGTRIVSSKSLGEYESMFGAHNFYRIHHSHLVNLRHVRRYIKGEGGQAIMSDGTKVDVSRRRKVDFIQRLNSI
ncbi:response regulator transcription factor [Crocinitomix catalasitica]|nr:response regulator transcription factor [Crocinitomix catalasitica]